MTHTTKDPLTPTTSNMSNRTPTASQLTEEQLESARAYQRLFDLMRRIKERWM
jgi:hypothetical protein